MAIPKEETIKEKVGGAVSGFFGGLFQAVGEALPNIAFGWVTGSNALEQAGNLQIDLDTTGWEEDDVKKFVRAKQNVNDTNPAVRRHANKTMEDLQKKYPNSSKKISAPNAGIQTALDSIDNAAYFDSKYGWLDDKALGDISKNQMKEYLQNFQDGLISNGISDPEQQKAAAKKYIEDSEKSKDPRVYILGNTLGDQLNRLLGTLTLSE